ncbi:hypothetical protein ACRB68_34850 [Actinomadura sp. RB68]|uniref:RNA polymerase sigma-70 region 2 domain-containing protein n=1 Tax=Actinomadura macrotermitis TaxID=2585200 RepID=A0A7K0BW53_9ACTN|nr:hypothetical protein [Actinomadura macrotermitis]
MGIGVLSDGELIAGVRAGDDSASAELFSRHHPAVLAYARGLARDAHTAEDLASEAFARTFAALRAGNGPGTSCRSYLYAVVRNTAVDWARSGRRTVVTDEVAAWADRPAEEGPQDDPGELDALRRAFRSLPGRWQLVLWHTVIEDEPPQQVSRVLGIEPGAVTQLSFRAREGLRQAFLAASCESRPECAPFLTQLAAGVRRPGLRKGRALRAHLAGCADCRDAAERMADLNGRLRRVLPLGLVVLGGPDPDPAPLLTRPVAARRRWLLLAGAAAGLTLITGGLFVFPGEDGPSRPSRPTVPAAALPAADSTAPATTAAPTPRATAKRSGAGPGGRPSSRGPSRPATRKRGAAPSKGVSGRKIRSLAVVTCLAPQGTGIRQTICGGKESDWTQTPAGGGFTLKSDATGRCLARGAAKSGGRYALTTAPCGGAHQTWVLDGGRIGDTEGNLLFADPVGVLPLFLAKPSLLGIIGRFWTII